MTSDTTTRIRSRAGISVGIGVACVVLFPIVGAVLPNGLPIGVVVLGLVVGALNALTAIGLILIYRSSKIINFAQAEVGGLATTVAVILVVAEHVPYLVAVGVGLVVAVAASAVIEQVVIRRLFNAPRLILTVATVGLAQVLAGAELFLPHLLAGLKLQQTSTFSTPLRFRFGIGPVVFNGNHLAALIAAPVLVGGLHYFLTRTDVGVAIRGAADSSERASLLGIRVRRLSLVTWTVAGGLSGVAALLSAPILGPRLGVAAGATALLAPLAAAVVARMQSLPRALVASLALGVFEQAVFWSTPRATTVDVAVFLVILGALLVQPHRGTRLEAGDIAGSDAVSQPRPLAPQQAALPAVRVARWALGGLTACIAIALPFWVSRAHTLLLAYVAIFGIIATSLVVLSGWGGQVSLGQFAFAGVGAATTAALLVHAHADLILALCAGAVAGALCALAIGLPALRISGMFLAVTTLAFAVPVSSYLLNSSYFPDLNPSLIPRPVLLQRFPLDSSRSFYYFCFAALLVAVACARNFRRGRAGRVLVAVRDNEPNAAAHGVDPIRAKLTAFMFSGALAGVAGGLYVVGLRSVPFSGFSPDLSLGAFTMVVLGGLGSLPGALLGAAYVEGAQYFLPGWLQLLATGGALLALLMYFPRGFGGVLFTARDWVVGLLTRQPVEHERRGAAPVATAATQPRRDDGAALVVAAVDAGYGKVQVLDGASFAIQPGETLALLGTNGAGKSTMLRVVAGLLRAQRGAVVFFGDDVTGTDPVDRVEAGIVTVPGGRGVFPTLTVQDNLRLGSWLVRTQPVERAARMAHVLELFPRLAERKEMPAATLSGGEQQMLTIAQALMCSPRILLVDELSLGLAPRVVAELLEVIRSIARTGTAVVLVEQSLNVAAAAASRAVFMERGVVRFDGPTTELTQTAGLARSVFFDAAAEQGSTQEARPAIPSGAKDMLRLCDVSKAFGGVVAVDQVSLTVAQGETVGIIGSNGSGKTTLLDLISGFVALDGGTIHLGGARVETARASDRARLGLGRLFQDAKLYPSMTVRETLAVACDVVTGVRDPIASVLRIGALVDSESDVSRRVEAVISSLRLEQYASSFIGELSTGTRRVVEIGTLLAGRPSVIILDEPSSGVAQRESEALRALLARIRHEWDVTMVIVDHDVPLVRDLSDRMICMHLGRVIAEGTPHTVLSDPAVVAAYLGTDEATIQRSNGASRNGGCLTVAAYARQAGISEATVRNRIRSGKLDAVMDRGRYLIKGDELAQMTGP